MRWLACLLLGAVAIQNTRPRSRAAAVVEAARIISAGDGDLEVTLEHSGDEVKVTATAETTGFLAFGFAHENEHGEDAVYDMFVGGVGDGDDAYGASYTMKGKKLTRTDEDRYKVRTSLRSRIRA